MACIRWWLVLLGILVAACGGGGGGGDAPPAGAGQATVGPDGGTVSGPESSLVRVPAGAASSPITVRIARDATDMPPLPARLTVVGDVWSVTPHGQAFDADVLVQLPSARRAMQADEVLRIAKISPGGDWTLLSPEATSESLAVTTRGFSWFVPVAERFLQPVGLAAPLALTVRSMTCDAGPCDALMTDASDVTLELVANNGAVPQGCTEPQWRAVAVNSGSAFLGSPRLAAIEPLQQPLDLSTGQVRFRFRASAGSPTSNLAGTENRIGSSAHVTVQLVCAGPPPTTQSMAAVPIGFPPKVNLQIPPTLGATVAELLCNGRACTALTGPQDVSLLVRLTGGAAVPSGPPVPWRPSAATEPPSRSVPTSPSCWAAERSAAGRSSSPPGRESSAVLPRRP